MDWTLASWSLPGRKCPPTDVDSFNLLPRSHTANGTVTDCRLLVQTYSSATTGLLSVPMPSISTSTVSPAFIFWVAPSVPIQTMSPG